MAKQYETVIGLEVHIELYKDKDLLWMQHRIRWRTEYTYLSGMYRYAGIASGVE